MTTKPSSLVLGMRPVLESQPISQRARDILQKVQDFIKNEVIPAEEVNNALPASCSYLAIAWMHFDYVSLMY